MFIMPDMKNTIIITLCLLGIGEIAAGQTPMKIEKSYDIPFSQAEVYAAWISSDTVIPPATRMDIKAEVGGHYRLIMESPDMRMMNEGKFLHIEPNSRVTYTWEWNGDGEISNIDVTFKPTANGTQIQLVHDGFDKAESVTNHASGWDSYVEGFIAHLAGK